jgi:chromosomal replication initiator protein
MSTRKEQREAEDHAADLQERIIASVAGFYKIDAAAIRRRTRKASIALPRQIAVYLLRDIMGLFYPSIGNIFGFDHSTAVYAYQKIKRRRIADARLNDEIQEITDSILRE